MSFQHAVQEKKRCDLDAKNLCIRHFHQKGMVGALDGEMIMNGPWLATDAYAYEGLACYTEPFQWLHGVNEKYGITWRLDVKLKDAAREAKGPRRYLIELDADEK